MAPTPRTARPSVPRTVSAPRFWEAPTPGTWRSSRRGGTARRTPSPGNVRANAPQAPPGPVPRVNGSFPSYLLPGTSHTLTNSFHFSLKTPLKYRRHEVILGLSTWRRAPNGGARIGAQAPRTHSSPQQNMAQPLRTPQPRAGATVEKHHGFTIRVPCWRFHRGGGWPEPRTCHPRP